MSLHKVSGRWQLGLGLSLTTVFLWGILPIALAITLKELDVYTVTWSRFVVSFSILLLYLTARKQLPTLEKLRSISLKLLAIALIGSATNYLLFLKGLALTSPSNVEVIIQLAPVLMGLGGIFVFKERYTLRQWVGLGILTLGFTLFFNEQFKTLATASTKYLLGSGLIVIAAIAWSFYALAQKQLLQKLPSSNIMLLLYGGCLILFTPAASPQKILTVSPLALAMLFFCGLNTLIAYGAFAESLEHLEASKVSAILATAPIFTLIAMSAVATYLPGLIDKEHITGLGILGAILVVLGSIAIALKNKNKLVANEDLAIGNRE